VSLKSDKSFCDDSFLAQLAEDIIKNAKQKGASSSEVDIAIGTSYSLTVRKGTLEAIDHSKGKSLSITAYFGNRKGTVSIADFKPKSISLALDKACHMATFTQEDPFSGLADKELIAYEYPDLDLYHPWQGTVDEAIKLAADCEAECFAIDKRITNSEGASVNTAELFGIYANSNNFIGAVYSSQYGLNAALIAEQNGQMQRDSYYTNARKMQDLETSSAVAIKAAERTVKRLGAKRIKTCSCPVIFQADVAKTLVGDFIRAISGSNLYHKASFLLNSLEKTVFPRYISIKERPHILKGLGSTPFDAEGVKLYDSDIVSNGILKRYVLSSYSARKLGLKTTGNAGGVHNIFLSTSDLDLRELQKLMGTGLLVTEILGDSVNIITGDYSHGVFGYWIENGEILYPVEGATIAGNLKDMFMQIMAVGNDLDYRSNIVTGSILIEKIKVAGE